MGIQQEPAAFLLTLPLPPGFSVCELGDQQMCGETKRQPAEPWYQSWGCGRYVSIDGNGRGTITRDLNEPVILPDQFDLVTDFGTGEHIFDQAQVWRTIHDLCAPGGYIAFDRPAQGYEKHAFYLVTDGLLRDLADVNHYRVLWLDSQITPRGVLIRGVFQKPLTEIPFKVPQQGRYRKDLVIA